jgi:pimeloyl-ACP methyl ester carboxylesterase
MKPIGLILVILSGIFISCDDALLEKDFKGGDYFYLENDDAIMPVWVRGNKSSGVFIVFLHGGPGNTSMTYAISQAHKELQGDYALVYYDQRGSGMSQGNSKPESYTINQFTRDLDKIIAVINYKYNNPKIFLLGKSWGGAVGTAYLLDSGRQSKIAGWVEEDGSHNLKAGNPYSWEWVKTKAREKIAAGKNAAHWQSEINWYDRGIGDLDLDYFLRHGANVNDLNGIYLNPDNDPGNGFSWASPVPLFVGVQLPAVYLLNHNNFNLKDLDLSPEMYKITIPSMVFWGRHDGTLPVPLAQNAYDNLGTAAADKYLYIFEDSAHCASFEEKDLWLSRMRTFIEKYR